MTIACFDGDLISVVNRDDSKVAIEFNAVLVTPAVSPDQDPTQSKGELTGLVNLSPETAVELGKILFQKGQIHLAAAQAQAEREQEAEEQEAEVIDSSVIEDLEKSLDDTPAEPEAHTWIDREGRVWYGTPSVGRLYPRGADADQADHSWEEVHSAYGPLYPLRDTP